MESTPALNLQADTQETAADTDLELIAHTTQGEPIMLNTLFTLDLTEHEQAVLEIMRNSVLDYYKWDCQKGIDELLDERTVERIVNKHLPEQFTRMATRHIIGIQPLGAPTGLCFYKNGYTPEARQRRIDNLIECGFSPEIAPRVGVLETEQDLRWGSSYLNKRLKGHHRLAEATEIEKIEKATACAISVELASPQDLTRVLDRQILRTLAHIAKPAEWDKALAAFDNPIVYAHPNNNALALMHGVQAILSEEMPEDLILVGCKYDEYHAPIYFMPYIGLYGKKTDLGVKYKSRFALVAPPKDWTSGITAQSSDLVYSIKVK